MEITDAMIIASSLAAMGGYYAVKYGIANARARVLAKRARLPIKGDYPITRFDLAKEALSIAAGIASVPAVLSMAAIGIYVGLGFAL